jgi:photosystem II stability/assembly factor-like uncharacterized protein
VLVVGTLKGVFRSEDGGMHWDQISPTNSAELHEVESIAIDPKDPKTIYAGTWHLPWKTTDGGANWHNIKEGLIDDSDVFSIIIDPASPQTVYTSACSGIYKSDNGGELYHKIQGIPSTARRTRVLMQDPVDHSMVYAGTTEGLYRTSSAGTNWTRLTGPDVIINDVYVDPKDHRHVLLATDRSGVLMSNDEAVTFADSNRGFSQRQVVALTEDVKDPHRLYAGVVNDKMYGGVFTSGDDGKNWLQQSQGLDGRDVFSLGESPEGTLLAGTSHGIFVWQAGRWQPAGRVVQMEEKTIYVRRKGKRVKTTETIAKPAGEIDGRVKARYGRAARYWGRPIIRACTRWARWCWPLAAPVSPSRRTAARAGSLSRCRASSLRYAPAPSRRVEACGSEAARECITAPTMARTGHSCPPCRSQISTASSTKAI